MTIVSVLLTVAGSPVSVSYALTNTGSAALRNMSVSTSRRTYHYYDNGWNVTTFNSDEAAAKCFTANGSSASVLEVGAQLFCRCADVYN